MHDELRQSEQSNSVAELRDALIDYRVAELRDALIDYQHAHRAACAAAQERVAARNHLARLIGVPPLHGDSRIVDRAKMRIGELIVAEGSDDD